MTLSSCYGLFIDEPKDESGCIISYLKNIGQLDNNFPSTTYKGSQEYCEQTVKNQKNEIYNKIRNNSLHLEDYKIDSECILGKINATSLLDEYLTLEVFMEAGHLSDREKLQKCIEMGEAQRDLHSNISISCRANREYDEFFEYFAKHINKFDNRDKQLECARLALAEKKMSNGDRKCNLIIQDMIGVIKLKFNESKNKYFAIDKKACELDHTHEAQIVNGILEIIVSSGSNISEEQKHEERREFIEMMIKIYKEATNGCNLPCNQV